MGDNPLFRGPSFAPSTTVLVNRLSIRDLFLKTFKDYDHSIVCDYPTSLMLRPMSAVAALEETYTAEMLKCFETYKSARTALSAENPSD